MLGDENQLSKRTYFAGIAAFLAVPRSAKTVLLISHRLANVVKSDKIYFLKDGEIKESGKHDELMSQNGAYRHLYESQMALENYGKGGMA